MDGMKLVYLTDGEYDDYGIHGVYWVPKNCNVDKVLADAVEALDQRYQVDDIIPVDWVEAECNEVHVWSAYWRVHGKKKADEEKARRKAIEDAKTPEQKAAERQSFLDAGGVELTLDAIFHDRSSKLLDAARVAAADFEKANLEALFHKVTSPIIKGGEMGDHLPPHQLGRIA